MCQCLDQMCFSPEADIATGILVTAVGVDALRHVSAREQLPLATLPLVFGAHQFVETFVWWDLQGKVSSSMGDSATLIYLTIAFLLPVWVPLAVRGVEPSPARRRFMAFLAGVGGLVAMVSLVSTFTGPVDATIGGHYIVYSVSLPLHLPIGTLYVVATCFAPLASSDRWIRDYGMINIAAVAILVWMALGGLTSLWCAWAAITSVAINLYLRTVQEFETPLSEYRSSA